MRLIRGLQGLNQNVLEEKKRGVTIGNFDGLHRGHQALLTHFIETVRKEHLKSVVILFEPQPEEFFSKEEARPRLMRFREKWNALKKLGIDEILLFRFDETFSKKTAEDFVKEVLVEGIKAAYVLLGDDFRFGAKRLGDFDLVQKLSTSYGFRVERMNCIEEEGERVSSTAVRHALFQGDLKKAQALLGYPYNVYGRVIHGDKRGRILGFPTANISLYGNNSPLRGVYCVKVHGLKKESLPGVANVGYRPTVDGTRFQLEVHLLDFNEEIYGEKIHVEFLSPLREEKRFDSMDSLKEQISCDVKNAKLFFGMSHHE